MNYLYCESPVTEILLFLVHYLFQKAVILKWNAIIKAKIDNIILDNGDENFEVEFPNK